MLDEKFSATSFLKNGLDTEESRELADLLEQEISKEMRTVIETRFVEIVEELNSMGHNLRVDGDPSLGEVSYRDDTEIGAEYKCKLRLAFDYVTSSGYAHLTKSEDV